jgi:aldose 1-epimerase
VAGTPFDFRSPTPLGEAFGSSDEQVHSAGGLDHNLVLRGAGWRRAATLSCPSTRTALDLHTDQPGVQVYTGNAFDGEATANGRPLHPHDGIALEPQLPPDTPNHDPDRAVLRPGDVYRSRTGWTFRVA